MPVLNFSEIPAANLANGQQDTFELFARDVLKHIGYQIDVNPDRGRDGGRDIIAIETRTGVGGETKVRWLVSCKHKSYTANSVVLKDEADIIDRIKQHNCDGFIGFYSTLPASSLTEKLEGIKSSSNIPYQVFDRESIEQVLLSSDQGRLIAERYFPISYKLWVIDNPKPAELFDELPKLPCQFCSKNLLETPDGVVVFGRRINFIGGEHSYKYVDMYWSCQGQCDRMLIPRLEAQGLRDGWREIEELCIPTVYLKFVNSVISQLHHGISYTDEYHQKIETLIIHLFPYISRELTAKEKEKIQNLQGIPASFGGLF